MSEALLGREPPTVENTHFQQISFVHQVFPEAEVGEGDLPGPQVEDDVAQLEVAMHDVATVKLLNDPGKDQGPLKYLFTRYQTQ